MDASKAGTTRAGADGGTSAAAAADPRADEGPPVASGGVGVGVHDLLSLGFIAEALQLSPGRPNAIRGRRSAGEEARRLPLLLRLLASARPLTSADDDDTASEADAVVPLLERVAACHPQAELI